MFRQCALCGLIKTVEAYHKQLPPKRIDYRLCKECHTGWVKENRKRRYDAVEKTVKYHKSYQQEEPILCISCKIVKPTRHYTTLESDGTQFSKTCIECETRKCSRCNQTKPVISFQRNPRVRSSFHRSCKECAETRRAIRTHL